MPMERRQGIRWSRLDLRGERGGRWTRVVVGLMACGFGVAWLGRCLWPHVSILNAPDPGELRIAFVAVALAGLFPIVVGGVYALRGAAGLSEGRVLLSLTEEGLTDHRTGETAAWADIRGVSLREVSLVVATLSIKIGHLGPGGVIQLEVAGLELPPRDILQLAQERAAAARSAPRGG